MIQQTEDLKKLPSRLLLEVAAESLIELAAAHDLVLEIRLVPTHPLRMGGYQMEYDVREARVLAEPLVR